MAPAETQNSSDGSRRSSMSDSERSLSSISSAQKNYLQQMEYQAQESAKA